MRYYKQFHNRPYVHLITFVSACLCLIMLFIFDDPSERLEVIVCAVFLFIISWILWKDRKHYLEINSNWIIHNGSRQWRVKRTDLIRIEQGRKGFVEEYDPYIKVHASGQEFDVDSGFLINDKRIEELVQAMQNDKV